MSVNLSGFDSGYTRYDAFSVNSYRDRLYGAVLLKNNGKGIVRVYRIIAGTKHIAFIEEGHTSHSFCSDVADIKIVKSYDCSQEILESITSDDDFAVYISGVMGDDWLGGKYYTEENANDISDEFYIGYAERGTVFDGFRNVEGFYVYWDDGFYDYTLHY